MNSYIYALTVYNGNLIAGGYFTTAGGASASHIASWDGSTWSPLVSGMNSYIYALTVYNGKLIAGGEFTMAGGRSANRIASWDGSTWSPLGSGMGGGSYSKVYALTVYNGNMIAGGWFTTAALNPRGSIPISLRGFVMVKSLSFQIAGKVCNLEQGSRGKWGGQRSLNSSKGSIPR